MLKALLIAMLEPIEKLRELEASGDYTSRLAMLEELKTFPSGAVWDYFCRQHCVPVGPAWIDEIKRYERDVLSQRRG
jgi:L-rhamnose isomerase